MDREHLKKVERTNLLVACVFTLAASVLAPPAFALGVAVGSALAVANFSAIRWIWDRVVSAPRRGGATALLLLKMLAILVLVALALRFLPISPVGLALGLSVFLVSIGIESFRYIVAGTRGSPTNG